MFYTVASNYNDNAIEVTIAVNPFKLPDVVINALSRRSTGEFNAEGNPSMEQHPIWKITNTPGRFGCIGRWPYLREL